MLHSLKELKKCSVIASDGEVGNVIDVLFDDAYWALRYFVVDTGNWLARHEIRLLSPMSVSDPDWEHHRMHMSLSRANVETSPSVEAHQPVSRKAEASLLQHYGIPFYWDSPHAHGRRNFDDEQLRTIQKDVEQGSAEDRYLRSYNAVAGYTIEATDAQAGHVVDFLFDEEDWSVQFMVVDPRDLWPGKHVLLPVNCIEGVYWSDRRVAVKLARQEIESSQEYDPDHLPASQGQQVQARVPGDMRDAGRPRI